MPAEPQGERELTNAIRDATGWINGELVPIVPKSSLTAALERLAAAKDAIKMLRAEMTAMALDHEQELRGERESSEKKIKALDGNSEFHKGRMLAAEAREAAFRDSLRRIANGNWNLPHRAPTMTVMDFARSALSDEQP